MTEASTEHGIAPEIAEIVGAIRGGLGTLIDIIAGSKLAKDAITELAIRGSGGASALV